MLSCSKNDKTLSIEKKKGSCNDWDLVLSNNDCSQGFEVLLLLKNNALSL